jgi:short-subunit dehydrogenase
MAYFKNKIVWVTGASSGIGRELCIQLASRGAKLVASARNEESLNELKGQLPHPDDCLVIPLDLTARDQFKPLVDKVIDHYKRVDILINNAGISQRSFVVDSSIAVDEKLMEVNYLGTVALTKLVLPHMLKNGFGHFAVVTSVVGKLGFGMRSSYSASKHALHGFFESLYVELAKEGIEITMICPGPIKTGLSLKALDGNAQPTGEMDVMQEKGMPVDRAAKIMLDAIAARKKEIIVGGFKEKLGVKLHAFLPSLFFKMASKQNPRGELKI